MAGYNSHTQVALKVLNRKVLSSPLLSFVTFHLPPPCVVRAVALRPSCSSSSPAEYSKRTAELDCDEDDDMALTTGLDTSLGLARRKRNIVVCGLIDVDVWMSELCTRSWQGTLFFRIAISLLGSIDY